MSYTEKFYKYGGDIILGYVILILAILGFITLLCYQSGAPPSGCLGSSFAASGGAGELLAEIFLLFLFLLSFYFLIHFGTLKSVVKILAGTADSGSDFDFSGAVELLPGYKKNNR